MSFVSFLKSLCSNSPFNQLSLKIKVLSMLQSIHDLFDGQEKIENHSLDIVKIYVLNLTYCFILTVSQWHLVNLGVEVHLRTPEIM